MKDLQNIQDQQTMVSGLGSNNPIEMRNAKLNTHENEIARNIAKITKYL